VGKHSESKLVGISPVDPASVPPGSPSPDQLQPFDLLGAGMFGFGGFCSHTARDFDGKLGAACARYFVSLDQEPGGMGTAAGTLATTPQAPTNIWPVINGGLRRTVLQQTASKLPLLKARLKEVAESLSAISNRGFIARTIAMNIVDSLVDDMVKAGPTDGADLEFIILVPGPDYTLRQSGIFNPNDAAVNERGIWLLRTFAKCKIEDGERSWEGPHVISNALEVDVPGNNPTRKLPLERIGAMSDLEYDAWEHRILSANAVSVLVNDALVTGQQSAWKVRESFDFPA
jgi:hypothetical protein